MAHLNFPPPVDAAAFERLLAELAQPVLNANSVNQYARQGQAQQGVDVSVLLHDGSHVGIQCKLTTKSLSLATVRGEVAKARTYKPALSRFIVATTAPNDGPLQEAVRKLPAEDFLIEVWSWDQINNWLNRYAAAGLAYVQHVLMGSAIDAEQTHAEALRSALDRPALLRSADTEHNFEEQFAAIRDTSTFLRTGYLYMRDGALVVALLPHRSYANDYVALTTQILSALDALDVFMKRNMTTLRDVSSPKHVEATVRLDGKRVAVLAAANRLFDSREVRTLHIAR